MGELINGIAGAGIHTEEITGFWSGNLFLIAPFPDLCLLVPFYKVSAFDLSFCVQFKFMDTLEHVAKLQSVRAGNVDFNVMRLDEQVVVLRVHWLPLYYDNLLLSEVMVCNYVTDVIILITRVRTEATDFPV